MADPVQIEILANIEGLLSGLQKGTDAFKQFGQDIEGQSKNIAAMIDNLKAPFLALSGLLAGGAMFKGAIKATVDWTMEIFNLSKVLNTSTQDASAWAVMLHTLGVSSETLEGTVARLQARMVSNAAGFEKWGVATKDAQGGALPMGQIIENMATKYQSLSTDQERNAMLTALAGRGWLALIPIMRMTAERLQASREEAQKLNLVVGDDGVAKARAYQESMHQVELIAMSLNIQIGNALLPTLTGLGIWLGSTGPAMAQGLAIGLKILVSGFMALKMAVEVVTTAMTAGVMATITVVTGLAAVLQKLVLGDFKGAFDAAKGAVQDFKSNFLAAQEGISASWKSMTDGMKLAWNPPKIADVGGQGTNPKLPGGSGQDVYQAQMQAEIEAAKAAYQAKKDLIDQELAAKKIAIEQGTAEDKAALMVEQAAEIAAVNERISKLDASETNYQAKLTQLQAQKAAIVAQTEHQISEATLREIKEREKAEAEAVKQRQELAKEAAREAQAVAQDGFSARRQMLDQDVAMGRKTNQERLQAEIALKQQELALELSSLSQEEQAYDQGSVKWQQVEDKKADAVRKSNLAIGALENQLLQERKQKWDQFFTSLTGGFSSAVQGLVNGTMTWGQAFATVLQDALNGLINFFVQWGIKEAVAWATSEALGATSRGSEAMGAAAVYAVNAAGSVAAIPITGWAMAPGIGASAYAQGMAWAGLASAAGGWDQVPRDTLAAIHKDEMVMSAPLASGIRNMIDKGGASGSSGAGDHFHVHAEMVDPRGFERMLNNNQSALVKLMGEMQRNGRR